MEAAPGFEPGDKGFAVLCLTAWLCRRKGILFLPPPSCQAIPASAAWHAARLPGNVPALRKFSGTSLICGTIGESRGEEPTEGRLPRTVFVTGAAGFIGSTAPVPPESITTNEDVVSGVHSALSAPPESCPRRSIVTELLI